MPDIDGRQYLEALREACTLSLELVDSIEDSMDLTDQLEKVNAELAEWRERGIMLPHWINRDEFADDLESAASQRHPTWFKQVAIATRKAANEKKAEEVRSA